MTETALSTPLAIVAEQPIASLEGRAFNSFTPELNQLLSRLQQLDDDALQHLALQATRLEQYAFRLRGAIASEMRRRIASRLSGGRGHRDHQGKGIRSCLRQLALEIGISVVTLTTDARIHDVFFISNETVIALDNSLPREYYVIALAAPDPIAAIRIAKEQAADNGCTLKAFRQYVYELKRATHISSTNATDSKTEAPLAVARTAALSRQRILVTGEARYALNELIKATNCSAEQIVADALIAHYRSSIESVSNTTMTKPSSARRNRRTSTNDDLADPLRQTQPSLLG